MAIHFEWHNLSKIYPYINGSDIKMRPKHFSTLLISPSSTFPSGVIL